MHSLSDESAVKEESMRPTQDVASSTGVKVDDFVGVDSSLSPGSYDSQSHSESSTFRASTAPGDRTNMFKTVSKDSSPKSAVCSNKSDLTEISSLRNYATAKIEEQEESSLQGAQATRLVVVRPDDDENRGDVAENHLDHKDCSVPSTILLGEEKKPGVPLQAAVVKGNDGLHDSEVEVTICDICGDLGRERLLAICGKCGEGAEHIYCMRVKLEEVPKYWVCEDCMTAEKDGKQKKEENGKGESLNATELELQSEKSGSFDPKSSLDPNDEELCLIRIQQHKAGSCVPAERSENGSETPSANQIRNFRKRKLVLTQDFSGNRFFIPKSTEPGIVSPGVGLPVLQKRPIGHSSSGSCACANVSPGVSLAVLQKRPIGHSSTGSCACANALLTSAFDNSSVQESILASKKRCNNGQNLLRDYDPSDGRHCLRNFPFVDPSRFHNSPLPYYIWRGRFKLQGNRTFSSFCSGVQAHLSRSASHNSLTLAPGFAQDILLEEASRSTVWATLFSGSRASAESTHIYFFTNDSESYENDYKRLLESMIVNDVYLKGSVGGFELLIFSSNTLEEGFQHWNGLYFLWGVFKEPTQVPSANSKSYSLCNQEHLQMKGRTFQEHSKLLGQTQTNTGRHFDPTAPNLELSLGLGGGGSTQTVHASKPQKVSSSNIRGDEPPLLSLSLSLPQPSSGEGVWRVDPVMTEQRDTERSEVDTRLSLSSTFCRI